MLGQCPKDTSKVRNIFKKSSGKNRRGKKIKLKTKNTNLRLILLVLKLLMLMLLLLMQLMMKLLLLLLLMMLWMQLLLLKTAAGWPAFKVMRSSCGSRVLLLPGLEKAGCGRG
jgi:cation transport ATPase